MKPLVPEDIQRLARTQQATHLRTLARAAIASAMYSLDKTVRGYERKWADRDDIGLILRATSPPASTGSAATLSQIVPSFLASLIPMSAGAALLQQGIVLQWDGAGGISLPTISGIVADWVSELAPIPVKAGTTAPGARLDPFKLAVITHMTGEMVRSSNAEQLVTDALTQAVAPALDAALFSNAAGVAGLKPPGLLNGITPLTPSTASVKSDAMIDDLSTLGGQVSAYAGNGNVAFVAAAKQAIAIGLQAENLSYPVLMTNALPVGTVVAVASPAIASVIEPTPRIDSSQDVAIHEETGPAALVDGAGVMAKPIRSMYQTDSVALRLRLPVSWTVRAPGAIAWMQAVTW
jgi:HK97 family phage major capsid protein